MDDPSVQPTQQEIDEESRRIRRLRILVHITLETIAGGDLSPEDAAQMIAETRKIALDMFPGKERAFDLIYRPRVTKLMQLAAQRGIETVSGVEMFLAQGTAQWEIWTGERAPVEAMRRAVLRVLESEEKMARR